MHKLGCDFGKSATKATCNGNTVIEFPPLIARAGSSRPFLDGRYTDRMEVAVDGQSWFVGDSAGMGLDTRWVTDERKAGRDTLLFLLAALGKLGLQGPVAVCTAVPAALWRTDGAALGDLIKGVHNYTWNGAARRVVIDAYVLPEPIGTYFFAALDTAGRVSDPDLFTGPTAIVDIGYRTVDIIVVRQGRLIDRVTRSSGHGVVIAFDRIYSYLSGSIGLLSDDERADVFAALVRGTPLRLKGAVVDGDLRARFADYRDEVADQITADVHTALSAVRYRTVLFTGGGAEWLHEPLLKVFPQARIADDPRLANVRGFYRYLMMRFGTAG